MAELEKENKDLRAKLDKQKTLATLADLDTQEKCAKQALVKFKDVGYTRDEDHWFENHYNTKISKCFVVIVSHNNKTPGVLTVNKHLWNAYENRIYGKDFVRIDTKPISDDRPKIDSCTVTLLSGEERKCHSSEEFDKLIRPYMEE